MIEEFRKAIADRLVNSTLSTCSRWSEKRIHLPDPYPGLMKFDKFPWLREVMNIDEDQVSIRKGSQLGFSILAICKALHLVVEKKQDVLYILPTASLVSDFTMGRLEPILFSSDKLGDIWGEKNVKFRQTHDKVSLYLRGSKSEASLVSIPLGHAIVDEYDRCSVNTLALVLKRFSAREDFYSLALSTPTLPEYGIDALYKLGTQEQFMFRCPSCSKHIDLQFPRNLEVCGEHHQDVDCARSYFKCHHCNHKLKHQDKPVWLADAKWEKTVDVQGHRSFHINQMYSPGMYAERIVREYLRGEVSEVSKIEFTNQTLGRSYIMTGARVTPAMLEECLSGHSKSDTPPADSSRLITMGIDVGSHLDVCIVEYNFDKEPGREPSINSIAKVLWEGRLAGNDWEGLDILMKQWQVQHCCTDFQPETEMAKRFARRFPGFVSLVQYRQGTSGNQIKVVEDENRVPTLTVDRTQFLDISLGRIHKGRILLPRDTSGVFKEHVQAIIRTYETDSEGRPKAVYRNMADDHSAHALNYAEIALHRAYAVSTGRAIKLGENIYQF